MQYLGWVVVIVMLLGTSSVALAEDVKPEPGFQLSLEERGAVLGDRVPSPASTWPRRPSLCSNTRTNDPRRPDCMLRISYGYRDLLRIQQRGLDKLNAALAKELIAPTPGVEMPLEERGPCSVIACEPMTPRKRALIEHEIAALERVLRNADMRPKLGELLRMHQLLTELMHAEMLELKALREKLDAACGTPCSVRCVPIRPHSRCEDQ